jgi:hypothetical protein
MANPLNINHMNQFAERFSFIIMSALVIAAGAVTGGTILWLLWEDSLTAMFPTAVSSGILAAKLEWWTAVKVVWIFGLLFKTVYEKPAKPVESPKQDQVN